MSAALVTAHAEPIAAFVDRALDEALRARAIAVVRIPAPRAPIDAPLRALRKSTSIAWRTSEETISTIGRAAEIAIDGADRFERLRPAIDAVFSRVRTFTYPSVAPAAPRLFGGCAFAPSSASAPPWTSFGDARFVLPRFSYDGATLTLAIDLGDQSAARAAFLKHEMRALLDALGEVDEREAPCARVVAQRGVDREAFATLVRSITAAITDKKLEKAVASRCLALFTDRDLDPWRVLSALAARYPSTTCFGVRFGTTTFVGASPERLFEKRGLRVSADALAGSIAADAPDRSLLTSAKDRREHRPVTAHLVDRLAPLCDRLDPPGEPTIRRLPNVLHLHTTLRGTLRADVHAIDVLRALHPTPAVCGMPVDAAAAHIASAEPHARGWYAGPVGWIDAAGDAELAVALRCGILRGSSAWLYAGGGIVEGSEPDAEWAETELKLRPLLDAIGAR